MTFATVLGGAGVSWDPSLPPVSEFAGALGATAGCVTHIGDANPKEVTWVAGDGCR